MAESTGTAGCGAAGLAVLTNGLPCVDVDDKARGLVPTQDLVLSWKGNITVTAMPGEQAVRNKKPKEDTESRRTRTVLSQEPQGWHMSTLSTCMAQDKGPKPLHAPTPPQQIPQTSPHLQAPIWSPASLQRVELSDIVHICKHCLPAMMLSLFLNYFVTPTVPISQSSWGQPWSQCAFPGRLTYG